MATLPPTHTLTQRPKNLTFVVPAQKVLGALPVVKGERLKAINEQQDNEAGILHQVAQFPIDQVYFICTWCSCPSPPTHDPERQGNNNKRVGVEGVKILMMMIMILIATMMIMIILVLDYVTAIIDNLQIFILVIMPVMFSFSSLYVNGEQICT